jgi:hypothetical protein
VLVPKESRENAFRNRPFDSIPKGRLARLTNIIVIGKGKTWFSRLRAGAVEIPRDVVPPLLQKRGAEKEENCKKGILCDTLQK